MPASNTSSLIPSLRRTLALTLLEFGWTRCISMRSMAAERGGNHETSHHERPRLRRQASSPIVDESWRFALSRRKSRSSSRHHLLDERAAQFGGCKPGEQRRGAANVHRFNIGERFQFAEMSASPKGSPASGRALGQRILANYNSDCYIQLREGEISNLKMAAQAGERRWEAEKIIPPVLPDQAEARAKPSAMTGEAAYSMWRTRRGESDCDLEEAWRSKGRIATTLPCGARHSTSAIAAAS